MLYISIKFINIPFHFEEHETKEQVIVLFNYRQERIVTILEFPFDRKNILDK